MIWIRLIRAAFLGAACSLVGGGAGMIRGAVLFVLLTSGIRLVHRCRLVWAALLCGSVAGGVAAAVFCRMPAGVPIQLRMSWRENLLHLEADGTPVGTGARKTGRDFPDSGAAAPARYPVAPGHLHHL